MASMSYTNTTSLRIGQINAQGSKTATNEIRKVAEDLRLDIVCVQEPYCLRGKLPAMPITTRVILYGDNPKAATIVFSRAVTITSIDHLSSSHCVVVEVSSTVGSIVMVNQYYQFEEPIAGHLHRTQVAFRVFQSLPVLLMADVNAKSILWNSPTNNERNEELQLLIQELGLQVENTSGGPPTYENRAGASSYIDVTLSNNEAQGRVAN